MQKLLNKYSNFIKGILIFIILMFIIWWIIPMFIYNNGLEQLSMGDKIDFYLKYCLFYKRGLAGFRKNDVFNLKKLYNNDPIGIKLFNKVKNNYKHGIAVVDLYLRKFYLIGNPNIVKYILKNSPHMFGPSTFKHIFMGQIMPKNIGVTKCPFSDTKICKKYRKKRDMNEELFKTNKKIDYYDIMYSSICKNITYKLKNHKDFKTLALNSMADLYFGHNTERLQDLLENMFDYVLTDSDMTLKTLFNKVTTNRQPIKRVANYIRDNNMHNSIFSRFKDYEKSSKHNFDLSNEIPHWIGPYLLMIEFFIPVLIQVIIKRKDVYDKIKKEMNSGILNLKSKRSYIHYVIVEFFRLFNIISVHPARISQDDIKWNGIIFPKNTELVINLNTLLRDETVFKNPDHFIPERWENKPIELQHISFGFGTQRCPSINFSPLLFKIIINNLFSKFDYRLNPLQYPDTKVPQWIDGFRLTF
tara:strand:- start:2241 stop:3656 length:1416 start_codon:yes stop_codon:yes gene_type:complete